MTSSEYDVVIYLDSNDNEPFSEWLHSLKDKKAKTTVLLRLQRLRQGNFGDHKTFQGLIELRIHYGPGFRIYCAKIKSKIILLLGGGNKNTQDKDIKNCIGYLEDHKRRNNL